MVQKKINNPLYFPMLVSERGDIKTAPAESTSVWEKFRFLSREQQDILTSEELPILLFGLQGKFRINDNSIGFISLFIRKIFFGELTLEQAEAKIGSMLMTTGGGDPNQARAIVDFIKNEIMTIKPKPKADETEEEEVSHGKMENLPLMQAITKYEKLGQQVITSEKIKIKSQIEPVRPSLVNWIKYYRDALGVGFHDSVQRGNFLFHSENCKRLSPEERERINLILKSVEENYPLPIDTGRFEIVFPEFATLKPRPAIPVVQPRLPRQSIPPLSSKPAPFQPEERKTFFSAPLDPKSVVPTASRESARMPSVERLGSDGFHAAEAVGSSTASYPYQGGDQGIYRSVPQEKISQPATDGAISFSSNHVFPAEQERLRNIVTTSSLKPLAGQDVPKAPAQRAAVPQPQSSPFRIYPVSQSEEDR